MALEIVLNGHVRVFTEMENHSTVAQLLGALDLKADRVAIELNGAITPRTAWDETRLHLGDRVELVHFVGGGAS